MNRQNWRGLELPALIVALPLFSSQVPCQTPPVGFALSWHDLPEEVADVALKAGDPAPDFALPDQHGTTVKLSDLRGQRVVVYFYPRADTPGCTTQACSLRDAQEPLQV